MKPRASVWTPDGVWIFLTRGKVAVVDHIDADLAKQNWYASYTCGKWYACRRMPEGMFYMHRIVAERAGMQIDGLEVDHRDLDGLMNVRSNLRPATSSQNKCNRPMMATNKSGHKGIHWARGAWVVQVCINKVGRRIGRFKDPDSAIVAHAEAVKKLHGDFARASEPDAL